LLADPQGAATASEPALGTDTEGKQIQPKASVASENNGPEEGMNTMLAHSDRDAYFHNRLLQERTKRKCGLDQFHLDARA
jgi:hypothetical protein